MRKRYYRAVLLVWMAGCAAQSDVLDIDQDIHGLEKHQRALQGRIEQLEKKAKEAESPSDRKGLSDLGLRLDELGGQVRRLTGQVEEQKHALSGISKKTDDRAFRINELAVSVQAIESRLAAAGAPPPPVSQAPDSKTPPIASQPPPATANMGEAGEEKVVLPGRVVGSRSMTPTEAYTLAYNDYLRGNDDLAIIGFQNFMRQHPDSILMPQVIYWTGEGYYHKKEYSSAIALFDRLQKEYPKSDKIAPALLKSGLAYLNLGSPAKAKTSLKKVVEKFPDSNEAHLAKDKLTTLR